MVSKILQFFNIFNLIFIWVFPAMHFSKLPESIPTHFGINGMPDDYSKRSMIWFLPVISTLMFLLLNYVSTRPFSPLLNIPNSLRQNAELTEIFVNVLNTTLLLMFADIIYESIQIALGKMEGLSFVVLIFVILMFLIMGGFFIYAHFLNKERVKN